MYRNYFPNGYNKKKLKMKKNAMDPVNFEEERRNDPKYKTELCKSFMETNFCVYGNKCRFAHGMGELVSKKPINKYKQKLCNSFFKNGYCPYGNRCNFKHDERKLEQIGVPFYTSHLICLHYLQLKTCQRLKIFTDITSNKLEEDKNLQNKEEIEKVDELSTSFSSEKTNQSSKNCSPSKENEQDEEINFKIDFLSKDLCKEIEFF